MGMCLDATPEMGEMATEVRSKSVTIYGSGIFYAEDGVWEIDIDQLPKFKAALAQIKEYLASKKRK